MAKANDLAKVEAAGALAAVPEGLRGGALVEGASSGPALSRMALFQGTPDEDKKYPGHSLKRGDFFDTLEVRKIGTTTKILPIMGWMSWVKFVKGQKAPVYSVTKRSEVPVGDLDWHDKTPPAASECVNMIVAVEGESWPYLFIFKRTALEGYNKVIGPMEARRGSMQKGPGLYELGTRDAENPDGQAYKRLTARFTGDPSPELLAMAATVHKSLADIRKQAEAMAEDRDANDAGDIPI